MPLFGLLLPSPRLCKWSASLNDTYYTRGTKALCRFVAIASWFTEWGPLSLCYCVCVSCREQRLPSSHSNDSVYSSRPSLMQSCGWGTPRCCDRPGERQEETRYREGVGENKPGEWLSRMPQTGVKASQKATGFNVYPAVQKLSLSTSDLDSQAKDKFNSS